MRGELPWHAFQMSDLLFAVDPNAEQTSPAGALWSLSVEWQFYLWWPFVVFLMPRRLPWVIAALFVLAFYAWSPFATLPDVVDRANLIQSLDSLSFGAALAWAQHRGIRLDWLRKAVWPTAILTIAGLMPFALGFGKQGELVLGVTHEVMNFFFVSVIYCASNGFGGMVGRILDNTTLQYIGRISYGIYVYHGFILACYVGASERLDVPIISWGIGLSVFMMVVSIVAAGLSWRLIELPINQFRRHLHYRSGEISAPEIVNKESFVELSSSYSGVGDQKSEIL
jgi:peptidoglycan/LPS O-acetylase OafA/YrhL